MKVSKAISLSVGVPPDGSPNLALELALPHVARVSYTEGDDKSTVTIHVGHANLKTSRGVSFMSGTISAEAARNLLTALEAWRDGAYE